jgi:hypothetical protein
MKNSTVSALTDIGIHQCLRPLEREEDLITSVVRFFDDNNIKTFRLGVHREVQEEMEKA